MNTSDQSGSYTRIDPDSARSGGLRPSTPPAPCAPGLVAVAVRECREWALRRAIRRRHGA